MKLKIITIILFINNLYIFGQLNPPVKTINYQFTLNPFQVPLDANNIKSYIWNTGVFNQDLNNTNQPGFYWPGNTIKSAIYSSGFCMGAYVGNEIRMAAAYYTGEYVPGYSENGQFHTDSRFKHYTVRRDDNYLNNPDWLNWGLMVPFGAPFIDANHNGTYEYYADTPGVKGAAETVFICLTDGDSTSHNSQGFGGTTRPLYAEVHSTAWVYDNPGYQDMQFLKWNVINKNNAVWDSVYFAILCEPEIGEIFQNYVGCDTTRNLAFGYCASDTNGNGTGRSYGLHPPACGTTLLNCNNSNMILSSLIYFNDDLPDCESEPFQTFEAYNYMKGFKKDGTPHVIPFTNPPQTTKFVDSGDPETQTGWTERTGTIHNCGGSLTGQVESPSLPSFRIYLMGIKGINQRINPGDTQVVQIAQMIARGTNNLNSVTKLKQLADAAKQLCENNFIIGINPISTEIPKSFNLSQNYPNPFNPTTKIRFEVPLTKGDFGGFVTLSVYNAIGQEVTSLVNEQLKPGIYSVDWNAANYPSGVYFYQLIVKSGQLTNYSETKKMVLLK